jgi:hypothetical protein
VTPLALVHLEALARRYFDRDVLTRLVGLPEDAVVRLRRSYVQDVVEAWRRQSGRPDAVRPGVRGGDEDPPGSERRPRRWDGDALSGAVIRGGL